MLSYLNKLQNPLLESEGHDFDCLGCGESCLTDEQKQRRKKYEYYEEEF